MKARTSSSPFSRRYAFVQSVAELLRGHPVFAVPTPGEDVPTLVPEERENAWALDTLQLFRRRLKLVVLIALLTVPFFWSFYTYVAFEFTGAISLTQGTMVLVCAALYLASRRIKTGRKIRFLTVLFFVVCALSPAAVMIETKNLSVLSFSGHPQIIIAMLFVPFSLLEAGLCASLVVLAFSLGLYYGLPDDQHNLILPRTISLLSTGVLVAFMAHLQSMTRRRAFDAAFDMAVSASEGAALSNSDFLTGGANRRHFEAMTSVELGRATRTKRPLCLLLFDLDGFKRVNDTFGHAGGDEVLREVFQAAQDSVRASDILARWGGDEFALALPETDLGNATHTANRVREAVADRLESLWGIGSIQGQVTLSMGIVSIDGEQSHDLDELVARADAALYQAKREGKNRVVLA